MMMMVTTLTVATAHPFVLSVSHDLLFRNPLMRGGTNAAASVHLMSRIHRHSARAYRARHATLPSSAVLRAVLSKVALTGGLASRR